MEKKLHYVRFSVLIIFISILGNHATVFAKSTEIKNHFEGETHLVYTSPVQNKTVFSSNIITTETERFANSFTTANNTYTGDIRPKIRLRFHSPIGVSRQILATEDNRCTSGYDIGFDGPLLDNIAEDMYWVIDRKEYIIQGVPEFNEETFLPLGIKIKERKVFTIKLDKTENWPENKPLYLRDKVLDSLHDIMSAPYEQALEPGIHNDRFEIVFAKSTETEIVETEEPQPLKPTFEKPLENIRAENVIAEVTFNSSTNNFNNSKPKQIALQKVMIFDMTGRVVKELRNVNAQQDLNPFTMDLPSGIYIVKTISKNKIHNKKINIR